MTDPKKGDTWRKRSRKHIKERRVQHVWYGVGMVHWQEDRIGRSSTLDSWRAWAKGAELVDTVLEHL